MSPDEARAMIRRFFTEVTKDAAVVDEMLTPEAKVQAGSQILSREEFKRGNAAALTAFPDLTYAIDDIIVEMDGDEAALAARWTASGTHRGALQTPLGNIAPTGRRVSWTGTPTARLAGGKVVAASVDADTLGMLLQLGAIAPAAPAVAASAASAG